MGEDVGASPNCWDFTSVGSGTGGFGVQLKELYEIHLKELLQIRFWFGPSAVAASQLHLGHLLAFIFSLFCFFLWFIALHECLAFFKPD